MSLNPEKILIVCQGDANDFFFQEITFLFKSLEKYGGKLKNCQKLACFVGTLNPNQQQELEKLGVITREIQTFDDRCIHANKIEVIKAADNLDYDLLLILDTDIIISDDFLDHLDKTKFKAKLEGIDPIGIKNWELIFNHFKLQFPSERFVTHQSQQTTIPFFCSAVIQIPKERSLQLYNTWKNYVKNLLNSYVDLPDIGSAKYYTDEIALTLSIQHMKIQYDLFPLEMNFSTHCTFHPNSNADTISPCLIHHHHRISKYGNPLHSVHKKINNVIDSININVNRQLDPEIIIDELYLKYLRRHGDKEGLEHYANLLEQKQNSLEEIKNMFILSSEHKSLENSDKLCLGNSPLNLSELELLLPNERNYDKKLLLEIINISRKYLHWFTRHTPRLIEYPWVIDQINDFDKKSFLEIGTGLSPLPLFLAERGAFVTTIDNSEIIRKITDDPSTFNEWGYLDYSLLHKNIKSFNTEISNIDFSKNSFDYVFSVSVIEHIPEKIRKEILSQIAALLKKNGTLILTVDLIKNTDELFNEDLYGIVDAENHGTLNDFILEIEKLGFEIINNKTIRDLPNEYVDMSFMTFKKL